MRLCLHSLSQIHRKQTGVIKCKLPQMPDLEKKMLIYGMYYVDQYSPYNISVIVLAGRLPLSSITSFQMQALGHALVITKYNDHNNEACSPYYQDFTTLLKKFDLQ